VAQLTSPYDLAIVGGGIVGALAAYLAARRRPGWRVVMLERSLVGHGATAYSGGLDHAYGISPAQRVLAAESGAVYREMRAALPGLPIFDVPFYGLVHGARAAEVASRFAHDRARRGEGEDLRRLRATYPDLAPGADQVLLAGCPAAYGVPGGVAQALVMHLRARAGLECREGTAVRGVDAVDGGFSLALADGEALKAHRVLAATGPWMLEGPGSGPMRAAGARIKKVVALHVRRAPAPDDAAVFFFDDDAFLLPLPHRGHWLFSFASPEWDVRPDASSLSIGAADRELALGILERYAPSLVPLCDGGRVFCDAYTPERLPVAAAHVPGYVSAGGCCGSGFRLAPAIAGRALELLPGFRDSPPARA
jgi:glycine/D-amino acid oxidase-like deaminating enzyme